jgi:carbamoyltransferase
MPAPIHVDGSARIQTVDETTNPLYWNLIKHFENKTGVPALINTSFNESEPIVDTPKQALETFKRTNMDILVMGNYVVE